MLKYREETPIPDNSALSEASAFISITKTADNMVFIMLLTDKS